MLKRLRQKAIGTFLLAALLAFAAGPGLGLHALGDAMHDAGAGHHHAFDYAADLGSHEDSGEHTCALDHEDDPSHAAGQSLAGLPVPAIVASVSFDAAPITYSHQTQVAPPSGLAASIDKPPRLSASA